MPFRDQKRGFPQLPLQASKHWGFLLNNAKTHHQTVRRGQQRPDCLSFSRKELPKQREWSADR
jgi:hypothetical protein